MARDTKWLKKLKAKKTPVDRTNRFLVHAESVERDAEEWSPFEHDQVTENWVAALRDIDDGKRNPTSLLKLLKSKYPLSDEARLYLADLIDRRIGKKGQKTPAYTKSEAERAKIFAARAVRDRVVNQRMSVADALEAVSRESGIPQNVLAGFYKNFKKK